MDFRVAVDVKDQVCEIAVIGYNLTLERFFKQTTGTLVGFVDGLGVGAKQVGEGAAGGMIGPPVLRGLAVLFLFYAH